MDISIPGVDTVKGLDRCYGDEDHYLMTLLSFADNTSEILGSLRKVSAETLENYAAAVKRIKDTSAAIGAEDLREAALKLEILASAGHLVPVQSETKAFLKHAETLVNDIRAWLNRNRG